VNRFDRADRARQDWLELHAHALTVDCVPGCGQLTDNPCVNTLTGQALAAPGHPHRIIRADHAARAADERARADRSPPPCDTTPR
jgi:hypothetical protein